MTPEELKKLTDSIADNIEAIQQKAESNETKTADSVKAIEDLKAETVKLVAKLDEERKDREKQVKFLEKQIVRPAGSEVKEEEDAEIKQAMNLYLKRGIPVNEEIKVKLAERVAKSYFPNESAEYITSKTNEYKSLMVGNDAQGGFFLRPTYSDKVIGRVFETSPIRPFANTITIEAGSVKFLIDDEEMATQGNVSEIDARNATANAGISELEIYAHEQSAKPKITQTLLDDAGFNVETWLQNKLAKKFARQENTWFVTGDGASKPKGFLAYDAWAVAGVYERNKVEQIESSESADFSGDDLIGISNSLIEDYQPNAVWMMKRTTFTEVMTKKDGQGRYLLNPAIIREGADKMLLGKPVSFANDMPAVAASALSIVYGDFSEGYTIVDRLGIRIIRDVYSSKPYVEFYTTKRVGGGVTNFEALKILKLKA